MKVTHVTYVSDSSGLMSGPGGLVSQCIWTADNEGSAGTALARLHVRCIASQHAGPQVHAGHMADMKIYVHAVVPMGVVSLHGAGLKCMAANEQSAIRDAISQY